MRSLKRACGQRLSCCTPCHTGPALPCNTVFRVCMCRQQAAQPAGYLVHFTSWHQTLLPAQCAACPATGFAAKCMKATWVDAPPPAVKEDEVVSSA